MDSTGVFYATATGKTGRLVDQIAKQWESPLHRAELRNAAPDDLLSYDTLLLGSPTYGIGDLHHHWPEFLEAISSLDLSGKVVGLFVMADGRFHGDSFAGALGKLYDSILPLGAEIRGSSDPAEYQFGSTQSIRDGKGFPGLVIDWSTPPQRRLTHDRISRWIGQLRDGIIPPAPTAPSSPGLSGEPPTTPEEDRPGENN